MSPAFTWSKDIKMMRSCSTNVWLQIPKKAKNSGSEGQDVRDITS